jgi:hypothetical protein
MSGPDFDELPLKVRDYIFKLEQENALLNNEKAISRKNSNSLSCASTATPVKSPMRSNPFCLMSLLKN